MQKYVNLMFRTHSNNKNKALAWWCLILMIMTDDALLFVGTAHMFDERMGRVLQEWCCRFPEDAVALNKTEKVLLHMVPPDKRFSVRTGLEAC